MNIVIPMAGNGQRFVNVGYNIPKPLIPVLGKPMIYHVLEQVENLGGQIIVIARQEHYRDYLDQFEVLQETFNFEVVTVPQLTQGPLCTVLSAYDYINTDKPLLILNSDQIVDGGYKDFVESSRELDGNILTFECDGNPKWSYVRRNKEKLIECVREKVAISSEATVGVYYFGNGRDFLEAAAEMIVQDDRTNGEFYVAPVYNYLISKGRRVGGFQIQEQEMHGLGTPEDLNQYISWKLEK